MSQAKSIIRPDVTRAVLAILIAAQSHAPAAQPSVSAASEVIARARTAVLGRYAPDGVRSLRLKGRLRVGISRDEAVDGLVDVRVLLPDHYLRVDTVNGVERRSGLKGRTPLAPGTDAVAER